MNGIIALLGSGEYLPVMYETDRYLLDHSGAGQRTPRVVCLPTAAGQEGEASVERWMRMGEEHFQILGADVTALHITNRQEADLLDYADQIEQADLIYFSGGKPHYLYETLKDSLAWAAVEKATNRGAAFAGCSAGAMFVGEFLPDFRSFGLRQNRVFGLLPKSHIFPHFDRMLAWRNLTLPMLQLLIPADEYVLGLDEDTALVGKLNGGWTVMGRQNIYVITSSEINIYTIGQRIILPA